MIRANSTWLAGAGGALIEKTEPQPDVVAALAASGEGRADACREERAAGAAGPLGKYADLAPPPGVDIHAVLPPPATVKAWHLRSVGRDLLQLGRVEIPGPKGAEPRVPRMRWCGSRIKRGQDGVGVYSRPDRAYGRIQGVCVCGQSLACPVCAPRVAGFRSAEVSECFQRATAAGYEARLETFTIPHHAGTSLGLEIDAFGAAWEYVNNSRRAEKLRIASLGHHVGREVTWSAENGWHYHHHRCRYDEPGKYDPERVRYYWLAALESVGRRTRGAEKHAFDCGVIGEAVRAEYVAKLATAVDADASAIGREVASSATKGRNLTTLLLMASRGDLAARRAWLSGVRDICSRKVSSVRWSRGLRGKVGMDTPEKSDEQVARDEVLATDVFLGALTAAQWRGVLHWKAEFALCCAANQGAEAVNSFLSGLGLGQLNDEARPAVVVPIEAETCYSGFAPAPRPVVPAGISRSELEDTSCR